MMDRNRKNSPEKVFKALLLLGLLIEIGICLLGFLLLAILIDAGFKYFGFTLCGIMCVYFICRNYFFVSASSVILGIKWRRNKFILLKNCIYISIIIILLMQKIIVIKIAAGLIINSDIVFMLIKGKWFLDYLLKLECYKIEKNI